MYVNTEGPDKPALLVGIFYLYGGNESHGPKL